MGTEAQQQAIKEDLKSRQARKAFTRQKREVLAERRQEIARQEDNAWQSGY